MSIVLDADARIVVCTSVRANGMCWGRRNTGSTPRNPQTLILLMRWRSVLGTVDVSRRPKSVVIAEAAGSVKSDEEKRSNDDRNAQCALVNLLRCQFVVDGLPVMGC